MLPVNRTFDALVLLALLFLWAPNPAGATEVAPPPPDTPWVISGVEMTLPAAPAVGLGAAPALGPAAAPAAATISEGFENAWPAPAWFSTDWSNMDMGEYFWGKHSCHPHAGSQALWPAGGGFSSGSLGCSSTYPGNQNSWAVYGPFDLSNASAATLTFYLWGRSEGTSSGCQDSLFVGSSSNGTNYSGGILCGDQRNGPDGNGYKRWQIDLASRLGNPAVWVAFAFSSNGSVAYEGFMLDDVSLGITPAQPAGTRRAYLPLITAAQSQEPAIDKLRRALNTAGGAGIFRLNADLTSFQQTSGRYCYGPSQYQPTCRAMTSDEIQTFVRKALRPTYFRAAQNAVVVDRGTHPLVDATLSYPAADRIRIAFTLPDLATFGGDVSGNEMAVDTFHWTEAGMTGDPAIYQSFDLTASFRSPVTWLPSTEWLPLKVTSVRGANNSENRCLRVTWQPPAANPTSIPVREYILLLQKDATTGFAETVRAPAGVTTWDDCSGLARNCYLSGLALTYQVVTVGTNGQQSNPAQSSPFSVARYGCFP